MGVIERGHDSHSRSVRLFPAASESPRVLLITAGSWVSGALEVEFGRIPPALLPVGSSCLFELICQEFARGFDHAFMTVPRDFHLNPYLLKTLADLKVEIIRSNPEHSIGLGVSSAIEEIFGRLGSKDVDLIVAHGDTIVSGVNFRSLPDDFFVVGTPTYCHRWGVIVQEAGRTSVKQMFEVPGNGRAIAGLFRFRQPDLLLEALQRSGSDWFSALEVYANQVNLHLVEAPQWRDFSSHNSYHHSKRCSLVPRDFNNISHEHRFVTKSSADNFKMKAEFAWFKNLPEELQVYTPRVFGLFEKGGKTGYQVEYLYGPTLAHLLVHGRLPPHSWTQFFKACWEFVRHSGETGGQIPALDAAALHKALYVTKTRQRLQQFCAVRGFDAKRPIILNGVVMPSLERFVSRLIQAVPKPQLADLGIVHGDFGGGNLFYDFSAQRVKLIDPRGYALPGKISLYGDRRYDRAKLAHSVMGLYDFLVDGHFRCRFLQSSKAYAIDLEIAAATSISAIQNVFMQSEFGVTADKDGIWPITILLFLSMLPLHGESPDRQIAFLANAYRLGKQFNLGLR